MARREAHPTTCCTFAASAATRSAGCRPSRWRLGLRPGEGDQQGCRIDVSQRHPVAGGARRRARPDRRSRWRTRGQIVEERYAGAINSGRPLILNGGWKATPLSINPEDAQLLESRGFSVEEVCRFFGVPPVLVGHSEKQSSWGTGIEQIVLGFLKFTMRPRFVRMEQALQKQLLTARRPGQGHQDRVQRRRPAARVEQGARRVLPGDDADRRMTINEVRRKENLPPIEAATCRGSRCRTRRSPTCLQSPTTLNGSFCDADDQVQRRAAGREGARRQRRVRGLSRVFGNVDSYGEMVMPGAFSGSLVDGGRKGRSVKLLWQHDSDRPIGVWKDLAEDKKGLYAKGSC
jgi:hypothetical protein